MPTSEESNPASSSSSETRIPNIIFMMNQTIKEETKVKPRIAPKPVNWPVELRHHLL